MDHSPSHRPKKHLGQHFLHDMSVIQRLLAAVNIQSTDHIVEIGPGLGALTQALCPLAARIDAVEYDRDLIPVLTEKFASRTNFYLHQADALKVNYHQLRTQQPLRIVGNLPYQISTPLFFHLLQYATDIQDMHFMLQKEVVQRMVAKAGTQHYGRLSVMTQYFCEVQPLFHVSSRAFRPPPKVDSQIIRLVPYQILPHQADNLSLLRDIVRLAFGKRRKTLKNCLKSFNIESLLKEMAIDQQRAEVLSVAEFVTLANAVYRWHEGEGKTDG